LINLPKPLLRRRLFYGDSGHEGSRFAAAGISRRQRRSRQGRQHRRGALSTRPPWCGRPIEVSWRCSREAHPPTLPRSLRGARAQTEPTPARSSRPAQTMGRQPAQGVCQPMLAARSDPEAWSGWCQTSVAARLTAEPPRPGRTASAAGRCHPWASPASPVTPPGREH